MHLFVNTEFIPSLGGYADGQAVLELLNLAQPSQDVTISYCHADYRLNDPTRAVAARACSAEVRRTRGRGQLHALADSLARRSRFTAMHGLESQP